MTTIRNAADSRMNADPMQGVRNIDHGIADHHVVFNTELHLQDNGHAVGSVYMSPAQCASSFGVAHTDLINPDRITVHSMHTNFNGTSAPIGVSFHYGGEGTKTALSPLPTNNRAVFVDGSKASASLSGDDMHARSPVTAFHAVHVPGAHMAPATIHFDDGATTQLMQEKAKNAVARAANWAGHDTSANLAHTCTEVSMEGQKSRWMIPKAAPGVTQCPLAKAFNGNRTSSAFLDGRYKGNPATVTNAKMQECFVVPHEDMVTTAKSLSQLLNPLSPEIAKGITAKFTTLTPVSMNSDFDAGAPTVTCSTTFSRHPLPTVLGGTSSSISKHEPYSVTEAASSKGGGSGTPAVTESGMIQKVFEMKLNGEPAAKANPLTSALAGATATAGSMSTSLQEAIEVKGNMAATATPAVVSADADIEAALEN